MNMEAARKAVLEAWRCYFMARSEAEDICAAIGTADGEGRTLAHRCRRMLEWADALEAALLALDATVFPEG